ncbi:MAG: glucokinase [Sphingomonadaceae bacterium]
MSVQEIVAGDIGGTNARFALARRDANGEIRLSHMVKLKVASHASFESAWAKFAVEAGRPLPSSACIAVAAPVRGDRIDLTNNPWSFNPPELQQRLGLDKLLFINDFAAVGHAVAVLPLAQMPLVAGPDLPLPENGTVSALGPGTGLGVALLHFVDGAAMILPTEGGHIDFPALDPLEDRILGELRARFRRASIERIVSGPGLVNLYEALARVEGKHYRPVDDVQIWQEITEGNVLARTAFDRWCMSFGSVAGDLALAHGAASVVLGGGIVPRIVAELMQSGFHARFTAKGRFATHMAGIPIRRIDHPEPGLLGAAAAGLRVATA